MQFVNRCFGAVNRSVTGYNGLLLSGDFDLSSVRAFFPDSADDGVRCSLSLLGELGGVANADMTMFLHEASFLYGVAGTEERAFPFLSSAEMRYIASLAGYFRNAGAKVVLTEQCLKSLRGTYATRYIGFVSSEDGTYIYKLHELLDAYPDTEKALRLQYDKRFQEACSSSTRTTFTLRGIYSPASSAPVRRTASPGGTSLRRNATTTRRTTVMKIKTITCSVWTDLTHA
jgi:hypothetical protein